MELNVTQLKCRYPGCRNERDAGKDLCNDCLSEGLDGEYSLYRTYLDEGMSSHHAKLEAGLTPRVHKPWRYYMNFVG